MKGKIRAKYVEPKNYMPKEILKKYGLGEYAEKEEDKNNQKKRENEDLRKIFKGQNK